MDDLDANRLEPENQREERRIAFLQTELQLCWTALDVNHAKVDRDAPPIDRHEAGVIELACQTMLKFLPAIKSDERRIQFAQEISHLQAALHDLKKRLWREAS